LFAFVSTEIIGYILEDDVFSEQGNLLLSKGHVLLERDIRLLEGHHIFELEVRLPENESAAKVAVMERVVPKTNAVHRRIQEAQKSYTASLDKVKEIFGQARNAESVDIKQVNSIFQPLHNLSMQQKNLFHSLTEKHDKKDYLYQHSIQVALISAVMAKLMRFSEEDCLEIGKAGLFHDIGKTLLPSTLLERESSRSLTKDELQKWNKHPRYGYDLLLKSREVTQWMLDGALYHHEMRDGTGYPQGLTSGDIPIVAQIISAANLYDNLSSSPFHHSTPSPYFAVVALMNAAYDNQLNIEIVSAFVTFISPSFVGDKIVLNNGTRAEIIKMQPDEPHRPIIRMETGEFVDLKQERKLVIEEVTS
jgi:HD-GYP domain-containing protein (c-di-GMP phosphodiesterase class II)